VRFAHFASRIRSHSAPRSLRNIFLFQLSAGTDCHPKAPASARRRGTVAALAWCQSLLKAPFPAKRRSLAARAVAEVFGSGFGKGRLTSSDLVRVYFSAFPVLPKKQNMRMVRLNWLGFFVGFFFPLCFSIEQPRKSLCNLLAMRL